MLFDTIFRKYTPFSKFCKQWIDIGVENGVNYKSVNKISGVEAVEVNKKFYDNCLLVEKTNELINQNLKTRSYFWFAPKVGLVKMIEEVIMAHPNKKEKACKFKEYNLITYGVD